MRKALKLLVIFLFIVKPEITLPQPGALFSWSGMNTALEKAKTENKPLFLMCYMSWCPHCKNMIDHVLNDPLVIDFYNKHFICSAQDLEKVEGPYLLNSLKIKSYPTFIFFDSKGTMIYRIAGELSPDQLVSEGKNALVPEKQLPFLKHQFDNDTSNSYKCYDYLRALKKGRMDYSTVVRQYFSTQSDNQLLSEINWKIISNGISDINSREFQFVLSHQKEYSSIASPERVVRKICYLVKELLNPLVEIKDTVNYFINRSAAAKIHLYKIDSLIFTCDIKLYELTGNWEAYKKVSMESTGTYVWNDYTQLKDIANVYLKNIPDTTALLQAVKWSKRALSLYEEYGTFLLCSRLYEKINKIQDALQMAQQGKNFAKKFGWDYKEAELLLNELQGKK